jgi:PhzF family phenazine biosynthesis protein
MSPKTYNFKKIDAFATAKSSGNPAGTVWLEEGDGIDTSGMLQLARELKGFVSEVGYIHKIEAGRYGLKFYSSEREVDFCGHATIAMMYELFQSKELEALDQITIVTNYGELTVENRIKTDDAVFVMAPPPVEKKNLPSLQEIARSLRISLDDLDAAWPVNIINAGLNTLIVPIVSLESILMISPDLAELNQFCVNQGIDIVEVFTEDVSMRAHDYRVRVFAPTFGYLEDPATGSGNSALGYYLLDKNSWQKDTLILEQNSHAENYNLIKLQKKEVEGRTRVIFGGGAIKRMEGEYTLY